VGSGQLGARDGKPARDPAGADDEPLGLQRRLVRSLNRVGIEDPNFPCVLVNRDAGLFELVAQDRVSVDVVENLADSRQEARVVDGQVADVDAVAVKLAGLADESGRMGECAHRHRAVVGCHAAEAVACDERRPRAQTRRPQCGNGTRRPGTDYDDVVYA
jgi:hypothetical protein